MLVRTQARSDAQAVAETRAEAEAQASAACPAPPNPPHRRALAAGAARYSRRPLHARGSRPARRWQVFRVVLRQAERSFSSASDRRVYTGSKNAGAWRRASRGRPARAPRRPQRQQQPAARGRPQLLGQQRAARANSSAYFATRRPSINASAPVAEDASSTSPGLPPGLSPRGRPQGDARPHHRARSGRDTPPCAWRRRPRPPAAHARGHAPHATTSSDDTPTSAAPSAARRPSPWPGDAHACERARSAADAHARQLAALHAGFAQQGIHPHEQLRVRRAMRRHLHRGHRLHRACRGVQTAQPDGDHLVRRIKRQRICDFRHSAPLAFEYGSFYGRFRCEIPPAARRPPGTHQARQQAITSSQQANRRVWPPRP